MEINIKKLTTNAVLPSYAKEGDAGLDLTATSKNYISRSGKISKTDIAESIEEYQDILDYIEYGTGLAIEIPKGFVGLVFPRSSISKTDLLLCNSVGVIDSGYRGEITLRFGWKNLTESQDPNNFNTPATQDILEYNIGDRIGQLIILPIPQVTLKEVTTLSASVS